MAPELGVSTASIYSPFLPWCTEFSSRVQLWHRTPLDLPLGTNSNEGNIWMRPNEKGRSVLVWLLMGFAGRGMRTSSRSEGSHKKAGGREIETARTHSRVLSHEPEYCS